MPTETATCKNCGTIRVGEFCHECGQKHVDLNVPLWALLAEAASEISEIERRLVASLWTLFRRPGQLTIAYLAGRRAAYVSPVRLYLMASVAFAAALAFSDDTLLVSMQGRNPDRALWLRVWVWSVLVMMPAFAGLLRLFVSRKSFLAEHMVFAMHFHAVAYLALALALPVVELSPSPLLDIVFLLGPPVLIFGYLAAGLRRRYQVSWPRAWTSAVFVSTTYVAIQLVTLVLVGSLISVSGLS